MSHRNLLLTYKGTNREINHRFRKFQKSKLDPYVVTKPKTKMIEVEVPIDDNGQ